jgi:hypothetical protein
MHSKVIPFAIVLAVLHAALAAAWAGEPPPGKRGLPARPDAEWDELFTRAYGWTGGDVVGTVVLPDGRTLWLFGDTWVGKVARGGHAPGSHMINNSIALHPNNVADPGRPPSRSELQFHWGKNDGQGKPTAWIVPQDRRGWYWPTGGAGPVQCPGGKPCLAVFLFHIDKLQGREGVWAFQSIGNTLATIDNFQEPVEQWQVRQYDVPHAISAAKAKADSTSRETNWGMALYRQRPAEGSGPDLLHIYGTRDESPLNRQLVLARVAVDAVHRSDAWRFYAGGGRWSASLKDAAPIAENAVSEFSVEEHQAHGRRWLILVHSEPVFGRRIFVRTSPSPEGPWGRPTPVYSVPDVDRNRDYFTYAAKGHLGLSPPGELLISYVVNSHNFGSMVKDAAIYRPRFVRVPLAEVVSPGER